MHRWGISVPLHDAAEEKTELALVLTTPSSSRSRRATIRGARCQRESRRQSQPQCERRSERECRDQRVRRRGRTSPGLSAPGIPRPGITIPFDGIPLHEHRDWFARLRELGYTDLWSAEVDGGDGFTPLALAAAWEPQLNLGVAITPAYTRGPALLAQSVAAMADAAPGALPVDWARPPK